MCWVLCQGPFKRWCASKPLTISTTWTTSDPKLHRCPSEPASQNTFNRIDPWKKAKIQRFIRLPPEWPIKTTLWSCTLSILKHQFANKKHKSAAAIGGCCHMMYGTSSKKMLIDAWRCLLSAHSWSILLTWFEKTSKLETTTPTSTNWELQLGKKTRQMWNVMATFGWLLFVRFIFQECLFYTSCSYYMLLSEPYCCWTGNLGRFARFSILGSVV